MRNILLILFILTAISHGARVGSLGRNDEVTVPSELNYTVVSNAAVSAVVNGTNTGAIAIVGEEGEAFSLSTTADITLSSEGGSGTINIDGTLSLDPENIPPNDLAVGNIGYNNGQYLNKAEGANTTILIYGTDSSGLGIVTNELTVTSGAILAVIITGGGGVATPPSASLYPDLELTGIPTVSLASFDAFSPPVVSAFLGSTVPSIAEHTRTSDAGDTFALTGESLSDSLDGRDTRFVAYGIGVTDDVQIQRLGGQQAALTLSSSLPIDEMYLMWPRNSIGFGYPVAINQTEAWWATSTASTGGTFTIYGRNLDLGTGDNYCWIEESDLWVTNSTVNPYASTFTVPLSLTNGTYTLWAHNGKGRKYGWSDSVTITIEDPIVWNSGVYDVTSYGAVANDGNDDKSAIESAINAATAAGSWNTVYFPAGTFEISGRITQTKDRGNVRYQGAGIDSTTLRPYSTFGSSSNPDVFIYNFGTDVKMMDLTLEANDYMTADTIFLNSNRGDFEFENVRFSQLNYTSPSPAGTAIKIQNSFNATFFNCEMIAAGELSLDGAYEIVIDGMDFYGLNDANTIVNSKASHELVIQNCTAQSYNTNNAAQWCKGRFFHSNGSFGALRNVYFGDNQTTNMTPRDGAVDQNSGEGFMVEDDYTVHRALATAGGANTITLTGVGDYSGDLITIIEGTGFGQTRHIVSELSDVVTVDKPWAVVPDTTSLATISTSPHNIAIYNNYFDGTRRAVTNASHIAATGIQPYGGGSNFEVDSNTFKELRQGLDIFVRYLAGYGGGSPAVPYYFNRYADNTFIDCRKAITYTVDRKDSAPTPTVFDHNAVGAVFRGNAMTNSEEFAIRTWTEVSSGMMDLTIFDSNTGSPLTDAVLTSDLETNNVWVGNTFTGSGTDTAIDFDSSDPAIQGNTWTSFATTYGGTPPGAVLELPIRVIQMEAGDTGGAFTLWNSGTASMSWAANEASTWLTLTKASGTVASENTTDSMAFTVSGTASDATINVVVGGITTTVTVLAP